MSDDEVTGDAQAASRFFRACVRNGMPEKAATDATCAYILGRESAKAIADAAPKPLNPWE